VKAFKNKSEDKKLDDDRIIELYWVRSEAAISETHKKYGKLFKYIAINILSNNEDAEECVNDTYLKAWNVIPPQKPTSLSAFCCKITQNLALKKYENKHTQKKKPEIAIYNTEI